MARSAHFACASLLLLAAGAPAAAEEELRSEVVYFGDLDLDAEAGASVLIRRIERASFNVCGDRAGRRPVTEVQYVGACAAETQEDAISDVGHPVVTALYYGYSPQVVIEDDSADPYADDPNVTVK
jgi:UrcA family protein